MIRPIGSAYNHVGLAAIGVIVPLAATYLLPESAHWLSESQISDLKKIGASSVVTALSVEIGRRYSPIGPR